jgi:hypothetical protein
MKDKKLQVFVSSTYEDLKEERQAAVEAILSAGHIPAGMELFAAGDESQMKVIQRWIDESDVFLLVLGGRYGSIDPQTQKSYIQLEYEYALKKGKPLFAIVITSKALNRKIKSMGLSAFEDQNLPLLIEFKKTVLSKVVKYWEDKKDIRIHVTTALNELSARKDLVGWIRADNSMNTIQLNRKIERLSNENTDLKYKLMNLNPQKVILYSGFEFNRLIDLLRNDTFSFGVEVSNALQFLKQHGESIINGLLIERKGAYVEGLYEGMKKLENYKLVSIDNQEYMLNFKLTEDGRNFYNKLTRL